MASKTLTYSDSVKGWVSFYSYNPDWVIGMNNYLYSFKGGNLYRHNVSDKRNTFYEEWAALAAVSAYQPSTIKGVFNKAVLENKLFKTISIQGDDSWDMQLSTDLQNSGYIDSAWFERKEATYFAFIRNNSSGQLALRSVNGIGRSVLVTGGDIIDFSISPLVDIGSIVSVGDLVFFGDSSPSFAGVVTSIDVNYPASINRIVLDTTAVGTVPIPTNTEYFLYIKNSVAESHGLLGHYCVFDMQNYEVGKVELFSLESEVMKSFS
jgi:hypothetical protein